jgi:diguanylate cyclase (GGDEF)-like protein
MSFEGVVRPTWDLFACEGSAWSVSTSEVPLGDVGRPLRYGALGALLSLGAPLGLALLRAGGAAAPFWDGLRLDLLAEMPTYAYVAGSTFVVFTLFGLSLGRQADRLVDLSNTDPLTGLRNARLLQARLEHEFSRHQRYREPLSLLLVDLDGLKQINDQKGHASGDAALRRVAEAIRRGSRATDLAARWGGDEFALLAPHTDNPAAIQLAERIRTAAAEGAGADAGASVSIGVATLDVASSLTGPIALVAAADQALYEAKRLGKNRVWTA